MQKRLVVPQNIGDTRSAFLVGDDRRYLAKTASQYHPLINSFISNAKPLPGLVQVLITALGAYPFWPQNANGDRFLEEALKHEGDDYGYGTFLSNANYFTHHVNKDPALAKGKVLHSVWNDKAKRVELIVGIDTSLDPEAIASIDNGESLCFSMGAKVPWDECSVCHNRARTRAEYCDHLKYQMNQIDPVSGLLVGALNTYPKFFDISRVLIPADKTAYMWTKVASASNPYQRLGSALLADLPPGKLNDIEYLNEKVASIQDGFAKTSQNKIAVVQKKAEIEKRIPLTARAGIADKIESLAPVTAKLLDATSPAIPESNLKAITGVSTDLSKIISTLLMLGIVPRQSEIETLLSSGAKGTLTLSPNDFNEDIAKELTPFISDRSYARPVLTKRVIVLVNRLNDPKDEAISKIAAQVLDPKNPRVRKPETASNPSVAAGLLAAIYYLMQKQEGRDLTNPANVIAGMVAAAIGAGITHAANHMDENVPIKSGFISVDDDTRGFYNNDWQSRFVRAQARPVTVIKTGSESKINHLQGLPTLMLVADLSKIAEDSADTERQGSIAKLVKENPDVIGAGILQDHIMNGGRTARKISEMLASGKRFFKKASLLDPEFLSAVPDQDREVVWDLAILHSADRIKQKLVGG